MRKITHAARVEYSHNGAIKIVRELSEKEIEDLDVTPLETIEWLMGFGPYTHVVGPSLHDTNNRYAVGSEGGGHE